MEETVNDLILASLRCMSHHNFSPLPSPLLLPSFLSPSLLLFKKILHISYLMMTSLTHFGFLPNLA